MLEKDEMLLREWKEIEWNRMYLSKGKEWKRMKWNGMKLSNLDWMF